MKVALYWVVLLAMMVCCFSFARSAFYYMVGAAAFYGTSIVLLIEYLYYCLAKTAKISIDKKTITFLNRESKEILIKFDEIKRLNLCAPINVIDKTLSFDPSGVFYFYEVETSDNETLYFTPFTIDRLDLFFNIKPHKIKMAFPSITLYRILKGTVFFDD